MVRNMKQHNRKKTAKIILIALFCIIIFFMVFLVCLIHNASTYVEKKYNKDFKIVSIKLPYYKDNSDSFDCPLLYRPGEFVPFAVNFKDTEKDFSVIYNKGEFYDDYQLEEINRYMKEYLINVTGDSDITEVLVLHIPCSSSYYEYNVLIDILKKDNTKWTSENIEILIQEIFADYNGIISIYLRSDFEDLSSLLKERETIIEKIESKFGKYYFHPGSNPINVCFVNYDLPTKRIDNGERFDYFGFEEDQNDIHYNEINEEQVTSEDFKIKKVILW